jgi:arylsulfatase A-like enzyme
MGMVRHDSSTGLVLDSDGEVARYRGEIAFLDAEIGRLLKRLAAMGFLEHAIVAVVGDHGEGLGEHGVYFEHAGMFEPILRVPLIFSGAGLPEGMRVDARVSTVSVLPTLLGLAGVKDSPPGYGRNLMHLVKHEQHTGDDLIFAESVGRRICAAWEGSWKLIWVPGSKETDWTTPERVMLFDVTNDPCESRNQLAGNEESAKRLRDLWGEQARDPLVHLDPWEGNTDTKKLEALGYVQ